MVFVCCAAARLAPDSGIRDPRLFACHGNGGIGAIDLVPCCSGFGGGLACCGARLIDLLSGNRIGIEFHKLQIPRQILRRLTCLRQWSLCLRSGLLPYGNGGIDLRLRGRILFLRFTDFGFGLGKLVLLSRWLDDGQQCSRLNIAVIYIRNFYERSGNLRRDANNMGIDKRIVG